MRVGLLLNNQQGEHQMLDLQEIRDMLLFTRVSYIPYHTLSLIYCTLPQGWGVGDEPDRRLEGQ
jgi:hypothetical protein